MPVPRPVPSTAVFTSERRERVRRSLGMLATAAPPAIFLLVFLVVPLVAILRVAAPTTDMSAWARGRLPASLLLGAFTSLLALAFGLPLAYLLGRFRFPGRRALRALVTVPFVMPVVVMAAGLLAFLGPNGLVARLTGVRPEFAGTYVALLVAHTIYNVPLVVRLVGDTWAHLDPRLEEAAATMGAGPMRRFLRVTLPRLGPAIAAAALLSFLFGFTAFGTVLFLADPVKHATLEVAIYHLGVRLFRLPEAATLALLQLGFTFVAAFLYARIIERASAWERPVDEETSLRPLSGGSFLLVGMGAMTAVALLLPLAAVVVRALDTPAGWGFDAFRRVFSIESSAFVASPADAMRNSVTFALLTVLVAVPLGALGARAVARARGGALLDAAWMVPLGTSAVTLGLGLIVVFPWTLGTWSLDLRATATLLVIAHILVAFPFVVRTLVGPVRAQDPALGEAARTLGARRWQRLAWLHMPLMGPALLVGAVFAASVSLGEFGATLVLLRPEFATVPVEMYRQLASSRPDPWLFPQAMALASILLVLNVAAFLLLERVRPGRGGGF